MQWNNVDGLQDIIYHMGGIEVEGVVFQLMWAILSVFSSLHFCVFPSCFKIQIFPNKIQKIFFSVHYKVL